MIFLQEALILADMHRVIVKVTGSQQGPDGIRDTIDMQAEGRHYYKNGLHYVLYDDDSVDEKQTAATVLKIGPDQLTLLRHGVVNQRQEFTLDHESHSQYQTPFGALELACYTHKLKIDYGTVSGTVDVGYDLSVQGAHQSENTLHIEIASAPEDIHRLN